MNFIVSFDRYKVAFWGYLFYFYSVIIIGFVLESLDDKLTTKDCCHSIKKYPFASIMAYSDKKLMKFNKWVKKEVS